MTTGRRGRVFGALGLLLFVASTLGADEAPWQRLLQGDDAKRAKELQHRINDFESEGQFAEAVKPAEDLLALRERVQGAAHWEAMDAKRQLVTLRRIAAMPEAAWQDIVTARKKLAESRQLQRKGRQTAAELLNRQALATHRRVLGELHEDTATILNDLAGNLVEQGRFVEAETICRQCLAIRRKVLGEEHPGTGLSFSLLAGSLYRQRRFAEAEPLHRQALDIRRKILGEEHADVATSLRNLALSLDEQGKHAEAEPLHRQALAIRCKILGEEHTETAMTFESLGGCLDHRGKHAEAEPLFRQALAIRRKVQGEQHLDTAHSFTYLASNLVEQGRYTEAESLHRQALEIYRKLLGEQHPATATSLNNLAWSLQRQGRDAEAESLYRQALAINRKALGELHPSTATSIGNLAESLSHRGEYTEAELLHRQALAIYRKVRGEQHPDTAWSLTCLAGSLDLQLRYPEAEKHHRQALAIHSKVLGEQHPRTAWSLMSLAASLGGQGRDAEAEPLYRQALAIYRKALGEQHPDTAAVLKVLAVSLTFQGKYVEAEPLHRQALGINRAALGERHPATARCLNDLALNLDRQGKHSEARSLYEAAFTSLEAVRLRTGGSSLERAPYAAKQAAFTALPVLLARLGDSAEAWRYAEAGLARGLLDDLSSSLLPSTDADEQHRQRIRAARLNQIDGLLPLLIAAREPGEAEKARLVELSRERDRLQAELVQEAAERSRREVFSLDRVRKQLPADAALVFWIDMRLSYAAITPSDQHWGCVVRRNGTPAWFRLPGSGDKGAWTDADDLLPRRLCDSLAAGETDWRDQASRLARQRLTPLQPALAATTNLPAAHRLIVVPAYGMTGVPLEALVEDRYTVSYTPSGTVYARLCEKHRPLTDPSLLTLGDPAFAIPTSAAPPPPPDHGVLLTLVLPAGNAHKAGLRAGDVMLRYGDRKLNALADLKPAADGEAVSVRFWREGKLLDCLLAAGKMGVVISWEPAAEIIRHQRELDVALAGRTRDTIKPLPGSRYEVKAVQALFPRATVLLGSEASERKLDEFAVRDRLKDFRVLHFATHGQVDLRTPSRSALLLACDGLPGSDRPSGKDYDGRLRVAEMAAWRLDADLVTLSACETALGPHGGGEGLLGFSQVLLHKGARSLLLSLWKVDDTATALLMTRFYENWLGKREDLKKPLPKTEALREAKTWLRQLGREERDRLAAHLVKGELRGTDVAARPVVRPKEGAGDMPYAHPRYWAAFVLLGDPD